MTKAIARPPCSDDAEEAVLGAALVDNSVLDDVAAVLGGPDAFWAGGRKHIYRAMTDLRRQGKPADLVTVQNWLAARGALEEAGGNNYLVSLWGAAPSAGNVRHYADIVRGDAVRRKLIVVGDAIAESARGDLATPVEDLLDQAESSVFAVATMGNAGATVKARHAVDELLVDLDRRFGEGPDGAVCQTVIPTGWRELDNLIVGLHQGELTVAAARTSVGKTIFASNVALRTAARGQTVFFASLEMGRKELAERMACCLGRVNSWKVRHGRLDSAERNRFVTAADEIGAMPLHFDDAPGQTVARISANARRLVARENLKLVVVDYLQLVDGGEGRRNEARHEEVARITRRLKVLAREINVPVLALAQLNREADQREPRLSDLRESGSIEQDSDCVLLLHKPEPSDQARKVDELQVRVGKNRNGPTGYLKLAHHKDFFSIEEPMPDFSWKPGTDA